MNPTQPPERLVVIVASAGGIPAASRVLGALPADFPVPVVVHQYLAAGGNGALVTLLSGRTRLPVRAAEAGQPLLPGHVYVAPTRRHLLVGLDGRQVLTDQPPVRHHHPSADALLSSAAEVVGPGTVAVVLTGAGRDGARGVTAVDAAGGAVVVQDPATAFSPELPAAVLATGCADYLVPVEQIPQVLVRLAEPAVLAHH